MTLPGEAAAGWQGGSVRASARCVLAANPGPMTLEGTNTWVVAAADADRAVVVDPGPAHERHLQAVLAAAGDRQVAQILLTHGHADHSEGAPRLAELTGAPVRALDPAYLLGGDGLQGGEVVALAGVELEVVGTPGHTPDSLTFLLRDETGAALLTGDTVLGRGTTVIMHPDGRLGDYLRSLDELQDLVGREAVDQVLPGHGPVLTDPRSALDSYRRHRVQRLDQVAAAVDGGARSAAEVVAVVYADVDRALWPAAELSVRAQLAYLAETGDLD
jgi:glyoxylase-like metal-dependent hydrolase (beta-lactamase superfamily II)